MGAPNGDWLGLIHPALLQVRQQLPLHLLKFLGAHAVHAWLRHGCVRLQINAMVHPRAFLRYARRIREHVPKLLHQFCISCLHIPTLRGLFQPSQEQLAPLPHCTMNLLDTVQQDNLA